MAPNMMHRDQGLAKGHGSCLGEIHTHQHRADQARGVGHGHSIDIFPCQVSLLQRLVRQSVNGLDVLPGSNFRHNTAVNPM